MSQFISIGRLDLPNEVTREHFYADMFDRYLGQTSLEYPSLNFIIPNDPSYETLVNPLLDFLQKYDCFKIAGSFPKEFDMPCYRGYHKNAKMKAFRIPGDWCDDCKEGLSLNWIVALSNPTTLLFREQRFVMNEVALGVGSLFVMDWGLPHRLHSDEVGSGLVMVQVALTAINSIE